MGVLPALIPPASWRTGGRKLTGVNPCLSLWVFDGLHSTPEIRSITAHSSMSPYDWDCFISSISSKSTSFFEFVFWLKQLSLTCDRQSTFPVFFISCRRSLLESFERAESLFGSTVCGLLTDKKLPVWVLPSRDPFPKELLNRRFVVLAFWFSANERDFELCFFI